MKLPSDDDLSDAIASALNRYARHVSSLGIHYEMHGAVFSAVRSLLLAPEFSGGQRGGKTDVGRVPRFLDRLADINGALERAIHDDTKGEHMHDSQGQSDVRVHNQIGGAYSPDSPSGGKPQTTTAGCPTGASGQIGEPGLTSEYVAGHPSKNEPSVSVRELIMKRMESARIKSDALMRDAGRENQEFYDLRALLDVLPTNLEQVSPNAANALRRFITGRLY